MALACSRNRVSLFRNAHAIGRHHRERCVHGRGQSVSGWGWCPARSRRRPGSDLGTETRRRIDHDLRLEVDRRVAQIDHLLPGRTFGPGLDAVASWDPRPPLHSGPCGGRVAREGGATGHDRASRSRARRPSRAHHDRLRCEVRRVARAGRQEPCTRGGGGVGGPRLVRGRGRAANRGADLCLVRPAGLPGCRRLLRGLPEAFRRSHALYQLPATPAGRAERVTGSLSPYSDPASASGAGAMGVSTAGPASRFAGANSQSSGRRRHTRRSRS